MQGVRPIYAPHLKLPPLSDISSVAGRWRSSCSSSWWVLEEVILVTLWQGVVSAIASGGHGGHGGYGHSSHGIGTACIVKVGADQISMHSLPYFRFASHVYDMPTGASHAKAFLVFWRDRLFSGLLLSVPLLQMWERSCPLQGPWTQGGRLWWVNMKYYVKTIVQSTQSLIWDTFFQIPRRINEYHTVNKWARNDVYLSMDILKYSQILSNFILTVRQRREEILLRGGGGRVLSLWLLQVQAWIRPGGVWRV